MKALIVDDELHARENLRMLLEEFCPEIAVVGDAAGVADALLKVDALTPDVVFLDIRMPSGSEGFDFIREVGDPNFQVVFVTAFKDYAIQAFNANAAHYLLKPVDIDDLRDAVAKLKRYNATFDADAGSKPIYLKSLKSLSEVIGSARAPRRITLHHAKGFRIVEVEHIVRFESDGHCTRLYFADGSQFLDSRHLKVYDDMLTGGDFMRVHRSHLINLLCLREYLHVDGHTAVMSDAAHVPVARARLSEFLTRVKGL